MNLDFSVLTDVQLTNTWACLGKSMIPGSVAQKAFLAEFEKRKIALPESIEFEINVRDPYRCLD